MTRCPGGGHDFPHEDDQAARCDEHGITLLWHGPPITDADLTTGAPGTCSCGCGEPQYWGSELRARPSGSGDRVGDTEERVPEKGDVRS
ncbi:hypothetical protein ACIBJC_22955 [Streptomyces sp. NPDC050509]|uniref:hypothetical protein n=1 Tax=Streptomyces sp. NPDC050509 TaxID=3365620 RepID=UPI003789C6E4